MKKLLLFLSLAGISILPLQAQITLSSNGQSVFGKRQQQPLSPFLSPSSPEKAVVISPQYVPLDSLATAVILGREKNNAGGYITFGSSKGTWIGERSSTLTGIAHTMELGGIGGFSGIGRLGKVFRYSTPNNATSASFYFYTDIRANSFIVTSDSRLKSDVKAIENSTDLLSALSPVSYSLAGQTVISKNTASKETALKETASELEITPVNDDPTPPDSRTRYGFLAQEVKELFPELVVEDEEGTMGIDYIGFIPILVDAVKDLRGRLEDQEKAMAMMGGGEIIRKSATADRDRLLAEGCVLEQNRPNPFSSTSVIKCNIPASVSEASIYVYDLQGQQILHLPVPDRDSAAVSIEASSLNPGMYIYSLITDGVEIDSKRMIVTD